jgi:hypothetical protein
MYEFIVKNWELIFLIGIIILGSIGYIEKISNFQWSRQWLIALLLIFLLISVGQVKLSLDSNREIELLETKLEDSRTELAELIKRTSPRTLAKHQREKLIEELEHFEMRYPIVVACRFMDNESYNYAEYLLLVFKEANWTVGKINRSFLDDIESDIIVATTNDEQEAVANRVARVLNSVEVECKPQSIRENSLSGIQPNTLYLIVGVKQD